jgi:4-amino-4-deoxy-L-arabinose transferase-like glycosyltransferase
MTTARTLALIVTIALLAAVRVASTHRVFSEVLDEPAHLAAGFEWFHGRYDVDASHPPLARVLAALPLMSYPRPARTDFATMGNELLYHGSYVKNLARMRFGNLLLLMTGIIATAWWAKRVFSPIVGVVTAAMLATLPPLLGHAGVATTDLAAFTGIALSLLALDAFLESATTKRGALLGLALGVGLLGKFSFLVFFLACAILAYLARRPVRMQWRNAVLAIVVACATLWAGYRFDVRSAHEYAGDNGAYALTLIAPDALALRIANVPIPAPAFFVGLGMLKMHDAQGHLSYLLGELSDRGWWYYFPVVFFYKTPLPFLILALWGAALLRGRAHVAVALMPLAILLIAMTSSINIGVRHILPLYAPLAMIAAYGAVEIGTRTRDAFGRVAFAALLAWLFVGVAVSHPDYLAWFNELAQPNPARIAVDSNLDWGQDALRLARVVRELGIEELHADVMTNARLAAHGIRDVRQNPAGRITGWVAVSETTLALKARWGEYTWLRHYRPVRRVGASIRLYHIE